MMAKACDINIFTVKNQHVQLDDLRVEGEKKDGTDDELLEDGAEVGT